MKKSLILFPILFVAALLMGAKGLDKLQMNGALTLFKGSTASLNALTRESGVIYYDTSMNAPVFDNGSVLSDFTGTMTTEFGDDVFRILGNIDPTKKIAFEADGIATGTTRTITMPNAAVDLTDVNNAVLVGGTRPFTANQSLGGFKLTSVADPTLAQDAATKNYVDVSGPKVFSDSLFRVQDNGDATKQLAIEVSAITTATTRTWTVPDTALNFSTSTAGTFATNTLNNLGTTTINASLMANLAAPATNWNVKTADVSASGNQSNPMIVQSGHKTTSGAGNTGQLIVRTGEIRDAATGATGNLIVQSGAIINAAIASATGTATFRSGDTAGTGIPGTVTIRGGDTSGTLGGGLILRSGAATGGGAISGPFSITSGDASTSAIVSISSGTSTTPGNKSGNINLTTGSVTGAERGLVIVNATALVTTSGGGDGKVKTADQVGTNVNSEPLVVQSGHQESGSVADTGSAIFRSGEIRDTSNGDTGFARFQSGGVDNALSSGNTGEVQYGSGDTLGTGDTGDVEIEIGTVTSGTRGRLRILDGTEGTTGHVWTSTDTLGNGAWAAPASSGANAFLSNLTSPTAVNQDLIGATGSNWEVYTQNSTSGVSQAIVFASGATSGGGTSSGAVAIKSGNAVQSTGAVALNSGVPGVGFASGAMSMFSEDTDGANSGSVSLATGAVSNTGNSGDMSFLVGQVGAGTRGTMYLDAHHIDAFEGTLLIDSQFPENNVIGGNVMAILGVTDVVANDAFLVGTTNAPDTSTLTAHVVITSGSNEETASTAQTGFVQIESGFISDGTNDTGQLTLATGFAGGGGDSGPAFLTTGNTSGANGSTGRVEIRSGAASGTGNSGNIELEPGTVSAGTRGNVVVTSKLYIDQTPSVLILRSPDGSCSSCGVDNLDVFTCASVTCP